MRIPREPDNVIRSLEEAAADRLADWPTEWTGFHWPGYTYEHTLRVRNLSLSIARRLGADERLVELAALLHDIGKPDGEPHGEKGAERADAVLWELNVSEPCRRRVCEMIRTHLAPDPTYPAENLALSDADYIDANFGYVAFARYITIRASRDASVAESSASATDWLGRVDDRRAKIVTGPGCAITDERYGRMRRFHHALQAELAAGGTGEKDALGIARYIASDARRPSLARQVAHMESVLCSERSDNGLQPSSYLREFVSLLQQEILGDR